MSVARVIPGDSVLPQLRTVLDARAMSAVLGRCLAAGSAPIDITACEVERVKYRPGRNCLVGYRLELRDPSTGASREQRLCAGIYAHEAAQARYAAALGHAPAMSAGVPAVSLIEPLDMVVWVFPHERKLGALPAMTDGERLRETLLPPVVAARWGKALPIAEAACSVKSYFPEHSCTIGATVRLSGASRSDPRVWPVLGKTRYDDAGAETFRCMDRFWRESRGDAVSFARPVLYQAEHRLLWQEYVPGATLDSLLKGSLLDARLLARVARALAAFHRIPFRAARRIGVPDIAERLIASQTLVTRARPSCAGDFCRATERLLLAVSALGDPDTATLHGDLHSNNVLINGSGVYLIDLDCVSNGPALAELGSLLAELITRACLTGTALDRLAPVLRHVVEAYRGVSSTRAADGEIDWYTAAALLNERALRCVTSLKPGRMEILDRLVDIAARIACGGIATPAARQAA